VKSRTARRGIEGTGGFFPQRLFERHLGVGHRFEMIEACRCIAREPKRHRLAPQLVLPFCMRRELTDEGG
jgi:hypothetical protein